MFSRNCLAFRICELTGARNGLALGHPPGQMHPMMSDVGSRSLARPMQLGVTSVSTQPERLNLPPDADHFSQGVHAVADRAQFRRIRSIKEFRRSKHQIINWQRRGDVTGSWDSAETVRVHTAASAGIPAPSSRPWGRMPCPATERTESGWRDGGMCPARGAPVSVLADPRSPGSGRFSILRCNMPATPSRCKVMNK